MWIERLTGALFNPRWYSNRRNPNSQPVKCEVKRFWPHNPIRAWYPTNRSRHMIVEPAMLIVRDQEQGFVPLRARPQRFVHLLHQHLSMVHVMRRVIIISWEQLSVRVPLLHHNITRQLPCICMFLKRQVVRVKFRPVLELP